MSDVEELLRTLAIVDHRAAVWCACQCARTVLHLAPDGETRPRTTIETVEAWVRGQADDHDIQRALMEATAAYQSGSQFVALSARSAAHSTRAGKDERRPPRERSKSSFANAATFAARAIGEAAYDGIHLDAYRVASDGHLALMLALVQAVRWPLTIPTSGQIRRAPTALRLAWEALGAGRTDLSILELIEAHARAGRSDLRWELAMHRAIAERSSSDPPA
ncbi:MAG: putative immunity protein [Myxococcota bacterium]